MRLALPATLFGISLLLGAAIVYESTAPLDPVVAEIPRPNPKAVRLVMPPAYAPPPEEMFADIDARPLFSAGRKPLADPAQSGSAVAPTDYSLAGVISDGNRSVALLRDKSASSTVSTVVGATVGGWHVTRIDPTSVTLHANGADYVLTLEGPADRPPSAPLPSASAEPAAAPPTVAPPSTTATTASAIITKPTAPTPGAATAPVPPNYHPTISPEALKSAPRDPTTGEPTL
jgi:hypothetical protein